MKIQNSLPDNITNILTDSRRIHREDITAGNTAFVALKTLVGDGHRYVRKLYEEGLRTFIVDSAEQFSDIEDALFVIAKEGTLDFLIKTAGERLRKSAIRQIVITGSKKKTTVKELLGKAFKEAGVRVKRCPRTWNSAMGATLSVFDNIADNPEIIITEVGIDAPGQAKRISSLLNPDTGIITSITDEHDEAFESHADKVAEKISLVKSAKTIVYVKGDIELEQQLRRLDHPNVVPVDSIEELIKVVSGNDCPKMQVSTAVEVRRVPEDGVLFIDSFTNDLDSLPLSLDLALQRLAGRQLEVFLGDFEGDRSSARLLIESRGGNVYFFDGGSAVLLRTLHREDFKHRLILLKGADEELITFFDEARHDTTLRVNLDSLIHNYNVYRSILPPETGIIAMVKADAYGLGALEVAKTLQSHGASYLAVAVVDEGVALRRAGIRMPIIVLNPITNRFEALLQYHLEPTVFSMEELSRIEDGVRALTQTQVPVHIKFDTGMHRVGFLEEDIDLLADRLTNSEIVKPSSVFSHLATADCPDLKDYTDEQFRLFERMSDRLITKLKTPVKRHLLNTAGIATRGFTSPPYEMARLGIGLYGVSPVSDGNDNAIRPVATLTTTIISLKKWPKGTTIGYGRKGVTDRESYIATLPIGYADGIDRRLGNGNAFFSVDGVACPTIGNVCMDLLMLDVTEAVREGKEVKIGTEVEIFGPDMPIENLSNTLNTIPYEILTSVSPRVRRTYFHR